MLELLNEMRPFARMAGVKMLKFEKLIDKTDDVDFVAFVEELYVAQFSELVDIWNLPHMTPQMWQTYIAGNMVEMKEYIRLRNALRNFRVAFNRYWPKKVRKEYEAESSEHDESSEPVKAKKSKRRVR